MKETGGPAFPIPTTMMTGDNIITEDYMANEPEYYGMTLRDYFAAKAMQGSIAHRGFYASRQDYLVDADKFYAMADAMLKARAE